MEKDDKIQRRQQQTQKYGILVVVSVVCLGLLFLLKNRAGPSAGGGSSAHEEQSLRMQQHLEQRKALQQSVVQEKPPPDTASFDRQKAALIGTENKNNKNNNPNAGINESREELEAQYKELDSEVRAIKKTGVIMETDPESLKATKALQDVVRKLIVKKYGPPPYRVKVVLEFPERIPDFATKGKDGSITIEMAPIDLIPVSVWTFLEVSRTWVRGAFHRNAHHVLQVQVVSSEIHEHLPFQEYSKEFPHKQGTTGYCGRPSGPCWYVSLIDNTVNHGPGSQQQKNPYEADANFGTIVEGFDDVVPRIHSIKQMGWLDKENQINILTQIILISDGQGGWKEWKDVDESASTTA